MSDILFVFFVGSTKIGEISDISKCFENFVSQTLGVLTRIYAAELREFKSNTVVKIIVDEDLDKNPTEQDHDEGEATYVLNGKKISFKRDIYTGWGEVDGDKLTLQLVDDGKIKTMVFTKR